MAWIGKFIGGSLGFMIGGPIGAIAGAVLGHGFDESKTRMVSSSEDYQMVYFIATFSMLGKLAKADGIVQKEEEVIVEDFMDRVLQLDPRSKDLAKRIFDQALHSTYQFEDVAQQFYGIFRNNRDQLLLMLELLFQVAAADKILHENEETMIRSAAEIFGFDNSTFDRLKSIYFNDLKKYYSILGCKEGDSHETIKKAYRKLVQDFHPDKVIAKGLPEEFIKFANSKFQEIQEAYEKIKESRPSS